MSLYFPPGGAFVWPFLHCFIGHQLLVSGHAWHAHCSAMSLRFLPGVYPFLHVCFQTFIGHQLLVSGHVGDDQLCPFPCLQLVQGQQLST